MNTTRQSRVQPDDQRKALAESEKKADEKQPENFKDEENADKKVEVGPDMTDDPIKGIDPE
jgi:hypothetical protein